MAAAGVSSSSRAAFSPVPLLIIPIATAFFFHLAASHDASDQLFKGINTYRAALNLSTLTENENAACLADQIAQQFKNQECTNSTGANTVPGTEEHFPNFLNLLDYCHLNATVTQDGAIMPACVPSLVPSTVLSNFTKSQYSQNLNDSRYVGAGVASEGDWVVVILSTNTPGGSFVTVQGGSSTSKALIPCHLLLLLLLISYVFLMP
uniref:Putative GPI-anchored protein At5g19250 n=1 Tax=Anthurium amnicola TaxID=1678845 RepID=A0A1D1Y881_9ARAE